MKITLSTSNDELAFISSIASKYRDLDTSTEQVDVSPVAFNASPKACFHNAQLYAQQHNATYVLGFIVIHGVPIEHAWVRRGSRYVDPTPLTVPATYYKVLELGPGELDSTVDSLGDGYVDLCGLDRLKRKQNR